MQGQERHADHRDGGEAGPGCRLLSTEVDADLGSELVPQILHHLFAQRHSTEINFLHKGIPQKSFLGDTCL